MKRLDEKTRQQLIQKSRNSDNYSLKNQKRGKNRFERRVWSKIDTSVRQYNDIDMNSFFKKDELNIGITVHGETDDYIVKIRFNDVLRDIRENVRKNGGKFEFKVIIQALTRQFNSGDVYVHCTCPDWKYRQAYAATKGGYNSGEPQNSNGYGIVNPNDTKGAGCKHVNLILANVNWLMKVASVINNYVNYASERMRNNYDRIIVPAIYGQQNMFKSYRKLGTTQQTLNRANKMGRTRGQYKKGEYKPGQILFTKDSEPNEEDNLFSQNNG